MNTRIALIQHNAGNTLGPHLDAVLHQLALRADYLPAQQLFAHAGWQALMHQYDGWVFLGGDMNGDDHATHPWLAEEKQALRQLIDQQVPLLGICLGSQLMARALNAPVTRMPQTEVGWHPLTLTPAGQSDPVMRHLCQGYCPFQWHNDTFALPQGLTGLAQTEQCANQAFRAGTHAWGVQFHPEVSRTQIADWLDNSQSLTAPDKTRIRLQTDTLFEQQSAMAQHWFRAFWHHTLPHTANRQPTHAP
jgi:GMP synthase (glutamine-hydrolysing)